MLSSLACEIVHKIVLFFATTNRHETREVMTEMMQLWDELPCSGQDRVVVLAATNRPWDLDPAVQVRAKLPGFSTKRRDFLLVITTV